jgi:hypothetical protein
MRMGYSKSILQAGHLMQQFLQKKQMPSLIEGTQALYTKRGLSMTTLANLDYHSMGIKLIPT